MNEKCEIQPFIRAYTRIHNKWLVIKCLTFGFKVHLYDYYDYWQMDFDSKYYMNVMLSESLSFKQLGFCKLKDNEYVAEFSHFNENKILDNVPGTEAIVYIVENKYDANGNKY
eukprot:421393_1